MNRFNDAVRAGLWDSISESYFKESKVCKRNLTRAIKESLLEQARDKTKL